MGDSKEIQVTGPGMLINTEVDVQIGTAKMYPRDIKKFQVNAMAMATSSQKIAASCFYKLKRGSATGDAAFIDGKSIRLAEIIASTYGNIRCGARIASEDDRFVTAQGMAWDLENNFQIAIEVSVPICYKDGKRFTDDLINNAKNSAIKKAFRNAIFTCIPAIYTNPIYEAAMELAAGVNMPIAERRANMINAFAKNMRVNKDMILKYLDVKRIEDITAEHLVTMHGVFTSIQDGEATVDGQFNAPKQGTNKPAAVHGDPKAAVHGAPGPAPASTQAINQELKNKQPPPDAREQFEIKLNDIISITAEPFAVLIKCLKILGYKKTADIPENEFDKAVRIFKEEVQRIN